MWMTPLTRCFSRMGALRFGDLGPPVRAAVGRCPTAAGNCRALCEGLPTRLVVAGDGPHPSPELATITATLRGRCPRRPCPPRALPWAALGPRPIQVLRSAADSHGQQQRRLTGPLAGSVITWTSLTTTRSQVQGRPCGGRPRAGSDATVIGAPASPQPEVGDGRTVGTWPFSPSNGRVGFDLVGAVEELGADVLVFGFWCS
jgi:hypothetical protein